MTRSIIMRGAFAVAVAGALGFGATQAVAGPAASSLPGCDKYECIDYCARTFQKGVCNPVGDGTYRCECI